MNDCKKCRGHGIVSDWDRRENGIYLALCQCVTDAISKLKQAVDDLKAWNQLPLETTQSPLKNPREAKVGAQEMGNAGNDLAISKLEQAVAGLKACCKYKNSIEFLNHAGDALRHANSVWIYAGSKAVNYEWAKSIEKEMANDMKSWIDNPERRP